MVSLGVFGFFWKACQNIADNNIEKLGGFARKSCNFFFMNERWVFRFSIQKDFVRETLYFFRRGCIVNVDVWWKFMRVCRLNGRCEWILNEMKKFRFYLREVCELRGRQHCEKCIVPRSFRFVDFSPFTETFHMDYCPEKKRDFCSQLLDFLEQQAKTQSSFLLSRFMRCPLEPLEPTFPFPSISFFSYEKMWQTYARTIQPDSNYFPKFIYLISDLLAFSKFNV